MYRLTFTKEESDAIYWHGHRYLVSELLIRDMAEEEDGTWILEQNEARAWELKDAWDDEGALSCACADLNGKLQDYIDKIV
jgi:hypothetical protein